VTLNPPKLSNCGNLTHLAFLFPKCPHHIFLKRKKIQTGWPATTYNHPSIYLYIFLAFSYFLGFFFFLFFKKKCDGGILGIIRPNGLNCHNLKLWGGVKCHFLNFGGKSENRWILQGGKM
jgi:hypothetical protein